MSDLRTRGTSLTLATWPGRLAPQHNERTTLNRDNRDTWGHVVTARQSISGHSRFRTVAKGHAAI